MPRRQSIAAADAWTWKPAWLPAGGAPQIWNGLTLVGPQVAWRPWSGGHNFGTYLGWLAAQSRCQPDMALLPATSGGRWT